MLLTLAVAHAEPCAARVSAIGFAAQVEVVRARIEADDLDGFDRASAALLASVGCLSEPAPSGAWARYLVGAALVAWRRADDWQTPLATALAIDPDIDRGVVSPHEIAAWTPPAPAAPRPARGTWFVDGRPADALPSDGVHVVQRVLGGELRSMVSSSGDPAEVLVRTPAPTVDFALSGAGGLATIGEDGSAAYEQLMVGADAQLVAGPSWAVAARAVASSASPWGAVEGGWRAGPAFVGAGVLVAAVRQGPGGDNVRVLPAIASQLWLGPMDLGARVAATPDAYDLGVEAALRAPSGPVAFRIGADGDVRRIGLGDPLARSTAASLTVKLGIALRR
jgi:hypothetical protein